MTFGKNDMQRVQGLRIEEESRRREEELDARLTLGQSYDMTPRRSRLGTFVARVRNALRR